MGGLLMLLGRGLVLDWSVGFGHFSNVFEHFSLDFVPVLFGLSLVVMEARGWASSVAI